MTTTKLHEQTIKNALKAIDWPALQSHLQAVQLDSTSIDHLIGLVRRCNELIFKRAAPKQAKARKALLTDLTAFLSPKSNLKQVAQLTGLFGLFELIDGGYQEILGALDQPPMASYSGEERAAGALELAALTYSDLYKQMRAQMAASDEVMPQTFLITIDDASASPDTILSTLVETTSMTLVMESYRNKWHGTDEKIILPVLPQVDDKALGLSGVVRLAAIAWRNWEQMQQKYRFLGGQLEVVPREEWPEVGGTVTQVVRYSGIPEDAEFDFWANERLQERLIQTLNEMRTRTTAEDSSTGISAHAPLFPASHVSLVEFHAIGALRDILGYGPESDETEPGGLRLVEWVRGYATLQSFMSDRFQAMGANGLVHTLPHSELVQMFERVGLSNTKAHHLIDQLTLRVSSRDLFDQPLIATSRGDFLVFGPSLIDADPARVTLSTLGNLGEKLEKKGKAFEESVLALFREHGLDPKTCNFKTPDGEFEFDALVEWGNYVFLFECKNRTLSSYNPIQAYYFNLELSSAVSQTKRQLAGLTKYRSEVQARTGIDVLGKTIIPCVLNSLPYSRPGQTDGVYLTDISALRRFLSERHFFLIRPYKVGKVSVLHRVALASIWKGETPQPSDLIAALDDPLQLKCIAAHTAHEPLPFSMGQGTIVFSEALVRTEQTIDSMGAIFGVSADWVRSEFDKSKVATKTLKAKVEKRSREHARKSAEKLSSDQRKIIKSQMKSWRKRRN